MIDIGNDNIVDTKDFLADLVKSDIGASSYKSEEESLRAKIKSIYKEDNNKIYKRFYIELSIKYINSSSNINDTNKILHDFNVILSNGNIKEELFSPYKLYDIIEILNRIYDGSIYSSRYFTGYGNYLSLSDDIKDVLTKIFISKEYKEKEFRNAYLGSEQESDILFKRIELFLKDYKYDLKSVYDFINKEIHSKTIEELFDIMEHRYDPRFNLHLKSFGNYYDNNIFNKINDIIEKELKDYVVNRIREELASRISQANERPSLLLKGLINEYLYIPHFITHNNYNDNDYMIIWAWNYMVYNSPISDDGEPLFSKEGKKYYEYQIAPDLADVLPALANYYNHQYSGFNKKYNSKRRIKHFSDQTRLFDSMDNKISPIFFLKNIEE